MEVLLSGRREKCGSKNFWGSRGNTRMPMQTSKMVNNAEKPLATLPPII
jgi:hypothetical protein